MSNDINVTLKNIARSEIIPIIYQWASSIYGMLSQNEYPLWPMQIGKWERAEFQQTITNPWGSFEYGYMLHIDRRANKIKEMDLISAIDHHIFDLASKSLFPRTLQNWPQVDQAVNRLAEAVENLVNREKDVLLTEDGPLRVLSAAEREQTALPTAYCILSSVVLQRPCISIVNSNELQGQTDIGVLGDTVIFGAMASTTSMSLRQITLYQGPYIKDITSEIDAQLKALSSNTELLTEIRAARANLKTAIEQLLEPLWWAANTGSDGPPPQP
jgi:hypothetical protein